MLLSRFVYKPKNGPEQSWTFDPDDLPSYEAELIEERTGWTYPEWWAQYTRGSQKAAHALLWTLLRREKPSLLWDEVTFTIAEYDVEADEAPKASEPSSDEPTGAL